MKRLIAGIVAGLVLALPLFASAQGIGEDKYKHAGVAAGMNLAMEAMGVKKSTRYTILGTIFIGKEIYDHNKRNATHGHLGDIVADIGGVVMSEGVIWLVHKEF